MYINVKVPRVVQIQYVEQPADKLGGVVVNPDFFYKFGEQLGEIYCISNIQDTELHTAIYQGVPWYESPVQKVVQGPRVPFSKRGKRPV